MKEARNDVNISSFSCCIFLVIIYLLNSLRKTICSLRVPFVRKKVWQYICNSVETPPFTTTESVQQVQHIFSRIEEKAQQEQWCKLMWLVRMFDKKLIKSCNILQWFNGIIFFMYIPFKQTFATLWKKWYIYFWYDKKKKQKCYIYHCFFFHIKMISGTDIWTCIWVWMLHFCSDWNLIFSALNLCWIRVKSKHTRLLKDRLLKCCPEHSLCLTVFCPSREWPRK